MAAREPGTRSARPPAGRLTINDVAQMAGVSKKTVSRVINESPFVKEDTRRAVEAIIRETGYRPDPQARGLAFRRSFLLGLIYDGGDPQPAASCQQGLLEAMAGSGFELVVRAVDPASPELPEQVRAFIEGQRLFGVVLPAPLSDDEGLAGLCRSLDCRYVRIAPAPLGDPGPVLVSHDAEGAAEAGRRLAGLGHRRIGLVSGPQGQRSSIERERGFASGLAEAGLMLDPALIRRGDGGHGFGAAAARELFELPAPPTAVFCLNDEMAAGVYLAARERGLNIPQDLSVIGFGDGPVASLVWPAMTSVRVPWREMGRAAGEMLTPKASGEAEARPRLAPELVVRGSTAKPG